MPSPSKMMMFLAAPPERPCSCPPSPCTSTVDDAETVPVASLKLAVSVCRPGFLRANPGTLKPPHWPAASLTLMPSVSTVFCAPEVNATGSPSR